MSKEMLEEIQKMNQEKTCWNCIFTDGDCCVYACKAIAILSGEKSAKDCEHFINFHNNKGSTCDYCHEICD